MPVIKRLHLLAIAVLFLSVVESIFGTQDDWSVKVPSPPSAKVQLQYGYTFFDYQSSFDQAQVGLTAPINRQTSIGVYGFIPMAYDYTMRVRYSEMIVRFEMLTDKGLRLPYVMPGFDQKCVADWLPGCVSQWNHEGIDYQVGVLMVPNDPLPVDVYQVVIKNNSDRMQKAALAVTLDCAPTTKLKGNLISDRSMPLCVMDPVAPVETIWRDSGCVNPRANPSVPWHPGATVSWPNREFLSCRISWYGEPIEYLLKTKPNESLQVFLGYQTPSNTLCAEVLASIEGDLQTQTALTPFVAGSTNLENDRRVLRFVGKDQDGDGYIKVSTQSTENFQQRVLLSAIKAYENDAEVTVENITKGEDLPQARHDINVGADAPSQINLKSVGRDPTVHSLRILYCPELQPGEEKTYTLKMPAVNRPEPGFCSSVPHAFETGESWKHMFVPRYPDNSDPLACDLPQGTDRKQFALYGPHPERVWEKQLKAVQKHNWDSALETTQKYWDEFLAEGAIFQTPETLVNNVFKHQVAILSLHRIKWDPYNYCVGVDGPEFYWDHSPRSSCYEYLAWDWVGRPKMSRPMLDTWLTPRSKLPENRWGSGQWDDGSELYDGAWQTRVIQWDAQGQTLWAITEHYLLHRDKKWLGDNYVVIAKGGDWIIRMLEAERKRIGDPAIPGWGLLYAEGHGEPPIGGGHSFYSNAFAVLGLRRCAMVARELGKSEDAERFAREAELLQETLNRAIGASFVRMGDFVGSIPASVELDFSMKGNNQLISDFCGALIWPCRAINPIDPLTNALFSYREDEGRRTGGLLTWPYIFVEQGVAYIHRGQPERSVDLFYTYLSNAGGTYDWGECLSLQRQYDEFDPPRTGLSDNGESPHTWATALFIEWFRQMLLLENGDQLHLAPATPRKWLAQTRPIVVQDAPTYFGPVFYRLQADPDQTTIRGEVKLDPKRKPQKLLIHIRGPGGRGLQSVKLNGKSWDSFHGDTIIVPEPPNQITLEVKYGR